LRLLPKIEHETTQEEGQCHCHSNQYLLDKQTNLFQYFIVWFKTHWPFKRPVKSHLPSAGIIMSSPYSPR
jgi:hypothetical protein